MKIVEAFCEVAADEALRLMNEPETHEYARGKMFGAYLMAYHLILHHHAAHPRAIFELSASLDRFRDFVRAVKESIR